MRFSKRLLKASSMSHGKFVAAKTITTLFASSLPTPSICTSNSDLTRREASCSDSEPRQEAEFAPPMTDLRLAAEPRLLPLMAVDRAEETELVDFLLGPLFAPTTLPRLDVELFAVAEPFLPVILRLRFATQFERTVQLSGKRESNCLIKCYKILISSCKRRICFYHGFLVFLSKVAKAKILAFPVLATPFMVYLSDMVMGFSGDAVSGYCHISKWLFLPNIYTPCQPSSSANNSVTTTG
uniref:Uncharacterized protein n=1 Tax=Glossina pallidipes TaxID=7398 RepID=A0A1A9ZVN2_GLOPL